jgi:hypothetical protein
MGIRSLPVERRFVRQERGQPSSSSLRSRIDLLQTAEEDGINGAASNKSWN